MLLAHLQRSINNIKLVKITQLCVNRIKSYNDFNLSSYHNICNINNISTCFGNSNTSKLNIANNLIHLRTSCNFNDNKMATKCSEVINTSIKNGDIASLKSSDRKMEEEELKMECSKDIARRNWFILKILPQTKYQKMRMKVDPYLRLIRIERPAGTWVIFWPCGWSLVLATDPTVCSLSTSLNTLGLFMVGAFVMRGAGCTINDIIDRDIDAKVERTKNRPLVSGEISNIQAIVFLGGLLCIGMLILLQLNWCSIILGASSMILVIPYPLAKRVTDYPQVMLGLTLNWGALLGWAALRGSVDPYVCLPLYLAGTTWTMIYDTIYTHQVMLGLTLNWGALLGWAALRGSVDPYVCLPLYLAGTTWTMIYDTIYTHQDKHDDALIGVKSMALKFGDRTKPFLGAFGTCMVGGLCISGVASSMEWPYYVMLAAVGTHLCNQIITLDTENPDDCMKKFKSNHTVGALVFVVILLGKWNILRQYLTNTTVKTNDNKSR